MVSAYPGCSEVVIQFRSLSRENASKEERLRNLDAGRISERAARRDASDNDIGRARSEQEAARRAASTLRRWCVQNVADRGLTLTYAPEHATEDMATAWADVNAMRRRLREHGHDCILIVPERHKSGVIHFHGAIPGWLDHKLLEACWGKGFVLIKRPKSKRSRSKRERCRMLASYLSKYLSKSFVKGGEAPVAQPGDPLPGPSADGDTHPISGTPVLFNGKRYSTSRGTAVRKVSVRCCSMFDAWSEALRLLGCRDLEAVWCSDSDADWPGPPTIMLRGVP